MLGECAERPHDISPRCENIFFLYPQALGAGVREHHIFVESLIVIQSVGSKVGLNYCMVLIGAKKLIRTINCSDEAYVRGSRNQSQTRKHHTY